VDLVLRLHFWDSQWLRAKDTVDGRGLAPPHIRNMIAGKGLSDVQVAAFTDDIKVALNTEVRFNSHFAERYTDLTTV
jgi:hypothetical protein